MTRYQAIQYLRIRALKFEAEEAFVFTPAGKLAARFTSGHRLFVSIPDFEDLRGLDLFHNHGANAAWHDLHLSLADIDFARQRQLRSIHAVSMRCIFSYFVSPEKPPRNWRGIILPDLDSPQTFDRLRLQYNCAIDAVPGAFTTWMSDPPLKIAQIAMHS